ncbi:MAG TPA: response regulator transcription factor [Caulobacteraceae bacterium]|jgi:two-component system OmpR family response regulator
MKLLLVEDDLQAADYLGRALSDAGHQVRHAPDGREGLLLAGGGQAYDVIVLDRMLPGVDGVTLLRTLRSAGVATPVILLTAVDSVEDRVEGLEAGADDYLAKPFAVAELLARLNALARRPPPREAKTELKVGDLHMDLLKRSVTRAGARVDLQPREFRLLEYLMRNAGRVVTRAMLLEAVWNFRFDPQTNIIESHMSRLRGKVDRGHGAEMIRTVRYAGYILSEPS